MEEKLCAIIAEILNVNREQISRKTKVEDVEQWDSLAHLMIIEAIENKLGKTISIEKAVDIDSVEMIMELIGE